MTKLYLLGVLFLIPATLAFSAVELSPQGEGGDGCGEWVVPDQPNTTEVHVLEFTKAMEDAVLDAIANIHLQARSISLDTRAIEKSVRDTASKASWKEALWGSRCSSKRTCAGPPRRSQAYLNRFYTF